MARNLSQIPWTCPECGATFDDLGACIAHGNYCVANAKIKKRKKEGKKEKIKKPQAKKVQIFNRYQLLKKQKRA
jgi:hypothetical protein